MTTETVMLPPRATVVEAARQMRHRDVGAWSSRQTLRGIVTDRDIVVRAVVDGDAIAQSPSSRSVPRT